LILQQQKIINELIARVSEYKKLQKQTQWFKLSLNLWVSLAE
jgi:hypothetical protein